MARQTLKLGRRWYVLHTYSGYEENVKRNLELRINKFNMGDSIFNVLIPKETKIKVKNNKRQTVEEKIFPGYVLVEMIVNDESWFVVRNTPNVTGFVGSGTTPTPISQAEMESLKKRMEGDGPSHTIEFSVEDTVQVTDGPFKGFEGKVSEVDEQRGRIKVLVSMFGRETPVELDPLQVKKN